MVREMTYIELRIFYLQCQVHGYLKDFNQQFFPNDYEEMRKELNELTEKTDGQFN